MSKVSRTLVLLAASALFLAAQTHAQEIAVYAFQPASKVLVEGTSNKSDWEVEATELNGHVKMLQTVSATDPGVREVRLVVPSAKLLSGKSTIMDRLMHKTLKVEEHPEIAYALTGADVVTAEGAAPNTLALMTRGKLTLAGVTRAIDVLVQGEMLADGKVRFTGSHTLLMTDYGMKPPTAMFGALHTGDEVVVRFALVVARQAGP